MHGSNYRSTGTPIGTSGRETEVNEVAVLLEFPWRCANALDKLTELLLFDPQLAS